MSFLICSLGLPHQLPQLVSKAMAQLDHDHWQGLTKGAESAPVANISASTFPSLTTAYNSSSALLNSSLTRTLSMRNMAWVTVARRPDARILARILATMFCNIPRYIGTFPPPPWILHGEQTANVEKKCSSWDWSILPAISPCWNSLTGTWWIITQSVISSSKFMGYLNLYSTQTLVLHLHLLQSYSLLSIAASILLLNLKTAICPGFFYN